VRLAAFRKTAAGGDTATVTLSASGRLNVAVLRFANAEASAGTFSSGSSAAPDSPSHAHGVSVKGLWISAVAVEAAFSGQWLTLAPVDYRSWIFHGARSINGVMLSFAMRELEATAEDPGAFALNVTRPWAAATILIPPV
jgi:hypothetical protein